MVAALAVNIQRTIYHSLPDPLHSLWSKVMQQASPLSDIHTPFPQNPVVVHWLLGSTSATMAMTLLVGHATSLIMAGSGYHWPIFGLDSLPWQTGYLLAIGSLVTLASIAGTFGLISTAQCEAPSKSTLASFARALGCFLGILSAFFGLMTIGASADGMPAQLRAMALGATVCCASSGVLLVTFNEPWESAESGVELRRVLGSSIGMASAGFMITLYVLHSLGALENHVHYPLNAWRSLAVAQYMCTCLIAVWPLTYVTQVRERWTPKVPMHVNQVQRWKSYIEF